MLGGCSSNVALHKELVVWNVVTAYSTSGKRPAERERRRMATVKETKLMPLVEEDEEEKRIL